EARELYEIAPSLGISPEERDRIEKAGQGEGLLVTTGRRVWVNLYGHTSPAEYAMANTDVMMDVDEDRRNGHVVEAAAFAAPRCRFRRYQGSPQAHSRRPMHRDLAPQNQHLQDQTPLRSRHPS